MDKVVTPSPWRCRNIKIAQPKNSKHLKCCKYFVSSFIEKSFQGFFVELKIWMSRLRKKRTSCNFFFATPDKIRQLLNTINVFMCTKQPYSYMILESESSLSSSESLVMHTCERVRELHMCSVHTWRDAKPNVPSFRSLKMLPQGLKPVLIFEQLVCVCAQNVYQYLPKIIN